MKIHTVEYAGSVAEPGQALPGALPQVAFSGRSNVGKSSLINALLGRTRRRVAHVSAQPGKTRMLNFYRVNDAFFLVDLPGFGYAKVPKRMRDSWKELVEGYLLRAEGGPAGVVHLVDSRHEPKDSDRRMIEFLSEAGLPSLIVLTKTDKLTHSERQRIVGRAARSLALNEDQIVPFSVRTGEGREELLEALGSLIGASEGDT